MMVTADVNPKYPYNSACPNRIVFSKYDITKVYWKTSATVDTVEWTMNCCTSRIHH